MATIFPFSPPGQPNITLPSAAQATPNFGVISIGSAPFDGTSTGHFVGNANGTILAANLQTFSGTFIDLQMLGASKFKVDAAGNLTIAGTLTTGAGALLTSPMTTVGDFIVGGSGGAPTRLAAGAAGQLLVGTGGTPVWQSSITLSGADFSTLFTLQGTTSGSSLSPNLVFRDNQATPQRIIVRKSGTAINVLDTSGNPQLFLDTAAVSQFNQGLRVALPSASNTTALTVDPPSGFTGFLLDLQVNGQSKLKATAAGEVVAKGMALSIANKTGTYTLTTSDTFLTCDGTSGAFTITLPAANAVAAGRSFTVKKVDGGSNPITVAATGSDLVDGAASFILTLKNQTITVVSDGTSKWYIQSRLRPFTPQQFGGMNAAAITAACTAATALNGSVYLEPGSYAVDATTSTPSNVTLAVESGALLTTSSGVTLTINGTLLAPPVKIFSGSGTVKLGQGCTDHAYAEWWGAVRNAMSVTDGVTTAGSAVITSSTANWSSTDVGKSLRGYNPTGQALVIGSGNIIASVQSATQCTLNNTVATGATGLVFSWGTDASAAINAAINAGAYTCPVQLLSGTYYCLNNLELVSGTHFQGLGAEMTKLMGQTWQGYFIDMNLTSIQDFVLRGFTVLQVGAGSLQTGVHLCGNGGGGGTPASASYGVVEDIHVDGGTVGVVVGDGSHHIAFSNLRATNQQMYGGVYGKGYWISNGCYALTWDGIAVDGNAGDGFCVDAGHEVSSANYDITVSNLVVTNFGGNGILLEGATRCVVTDFVINGGTPTTSSNGVFLQEDQKAIPTDYCVVGPGLVENVGAGAIILAGARYNHIHDVTVHNLGLFSSGTTVSIASFTGQDSGLTAHDTSDNTFSNIKVMQDAGVGTYSQAVAFNTTTTNLQRNHFHTCEWGTPNQTIYNTYAAPAVGPSPLTGTNANTLDNLDVDSAADPFGIYFGAARDTRLYRSGVNSLHTPASLTTDGLLAASGGLATTTTSVAGNHTAAFNESVILVSAAGGTCTVTLPAATTGGRLYIIKKTDSSGNAVTVAPSGTDTIDGAANQVITTQNGVLRLVANGVSAWWLI